MKLIRKRMNFSKKIRKNIKMVLLLFINLAEEEEKELKEYKNKLQNSIKTILSEKFSEIENDEFKKQIEERVLSSNFITEDYIDLISRIKTFNHVKEILDSKIVVVRVDLEEEFIYDEVVNEDGTSSKVFRHTDFGKAKETILPISVNMFIDNRAKLVILLAGYGPRQGSYDEKYSMDHFIKYLQRVKLNTL